MSDFDKFELCGPDVLVRYRRAELLGFGFLEEPGTLIGWVQERTPELVVVRSSGLLFCCQMSDVEEMLWHASLDPRVQVTA